MFKFFKIFRESKNKLLIVTAKTNYDKRQINTYKHTINKYLAIV